MNHIPFVLRYFFSIIVSKLATPISRFSKTIDDNCKTEWAIIWLV